MDVTGTYWRANYGEISEALQFRIGPVGSTIWTETFPAGQLTDLINVLTSIGSAGIGQLVTGTHLQARRVPNTWHDDVSIEPRSNLFPPSLMRFYNIERPDLIAVLTTLQAAITAGTEPDDWDFSSPPDLDLETLPSYLHPEQLSATFADKSTTETALSGKVTAGVASGNVVLGSATVHTPPADTDTRFEVVKSITDPNVTFLGALSGYAVYFGTEGVSAGSIQGGACEAYSLMTGAVTHAVLGWEGVGSVAGTGSYQQVIGLASTAQAKDTTTVQQLMGFQARGPLGAGTVANAYSIKVLEPSVGTNRHSVHVTGRTTLALGVHSSVLDILGTASVRRWTVDANGAFLGYASDGTSLRTTLESNEVTTGRFMSDAYTATTKHLSLKWQGSEKFAVLGDGYVVFGDTMRQTTVGAAGAASALPATPTTYIKWKTASGTILVIPAYAAS
jgi:hypothetical protein